MDLIHNLKNYVPWLAFISGMAGSLHCVGMCGGLVAASSKQTSDVIRYQIGRLIGYLILGFFAGLLGKIISAQMSHTNLSFLPGLLMGLLFIYWGIQNYRGKKSLVFLNNLNAWTYKKIIPIFVFKNNGISKSFFIGLFSIFLPCGLLYGVVVGVAALNHSMQAVFTMLFFWLGTLPAMIVAPSLVHKILKPLKAKLPRTYAFSLIALGILTISVRLVQFNHANAGRLSAKKDIVAPLKCH